MPTYNVEFTFEHLDSALRPENARYGSGTVPIVTDAEPTTDEDFKEIAKVIGRQIPDCKRLVVNNVIQTGADTSPSEFTGDTIEGFILDD